MDRKYKSLTFKQCQTIYDRITKSRSKATQSRFLNSQIRRAAVVNYILPTVESKEDAPLLLEDLANSSPIHGSALKLKERLTFGRGFSLDSIKDEEVKKALSCLNSRGQNINEILKQVVRDYLLYGGFALEVIYSEAGTIVGVNRRNFSCIRVIDVDCEGTPCLYAYDNRLDPSLYNPKEVYKAYRPFNPEYWSDLRAKKEEDPLYVRQSWTEEDVLNATQLIYYIDNKDSTEFTRYYPLPDYISGINAIEIDKETYISDRSSIVTGAGGMTIITLKSGSTDDKQNQEIAEDMMSKVVGARNTGNVILFTSSPNAPDSPIEVTQIEGLQPDRYNALRESTEQAIATSHGIPSVLLNIKQNSGLANNAEERKEALTEFTKTVIAAYQDSLIKVFNAILSYMEVGDLQLSIQPLFEDEVIKEKSSTIEEDNSLNDTTITAK